MEVITPALLSREEFAEQVWGWAGGWYVPNQPSIDAYSAALSRVEELEKQVADLDVSRKWATTMAAEGRTEMLAAIARSTAAEAEVARLREVIGSLEERVEFYSIAAGMGDD